MLEKLHVVDLSTNVAGQYAAQLFATYGADVIKVEPPYGDPLRFVEPRVGESADGGVLFGYLNAGKRSVTLDAASSEGRATLDVLLLTADVVIESSQPGRSSLFAPDLEALARKRPALVICSLTPYGRSGPRAGWRATSLTAFASGGQMMMTGEPVCEPLKTAGQQAWYQAGLHGFGATLTALYAAWHDGRGDWLDISVQEAQAIALEGAGPAAMARGVDSERMGNALHAGLCMYPCADGYVSVATLQRQTKALFTCIGQPELFEDPRFATAAARRANNDLMRSIILAWTMDRTVEQIIAEAERTDTPFTRILTPREVLAWQPLREAGYWQAVEHPVLGRYELPSGPFSIDGDRGVGRRAPLLGEHTASIIEDVQQRTDGASPARSPVADETVLPPLHGVRVVDLTAVWAGPFAARLLGEMGADVIKLEGPRTPDAVRLLVSADLSDWGYNRVPYFNEYNRRKRAVSLDLNDPRGREVFLELVSCADVVIENWRADVLRRLGLDYETLRAVNPNVVVVSMPGFAETGVEALRPGYGSLIESMAGLVSIQGYEDGPPQKSGVSYGDPVAGVTAAAAVALALLVREQSGHGSRVVVPQRDAVIGLIGEYVLGEAVGQSLQQARTGNHHSLHCPHNVYRTRDDFGRMQANAAGAPIAEFHDTWLALDVEDDCAWRSLREVVDDPRLAEPSFATAAGRKQGEASIDAVLAEWARERDALECAEQLQRAGVAAAPVLSPLMLVRDAHLAARGFYTAVEHPEFGRHTCTVPNWRMAVHPPGPNAPAPCYGEHNRAVLGGMLGLGGVEIAELLDAGLVVDVPRGT